MRALALLLGLAAVCATVAIAGQEPELPVWLKAAHAAEMAGARRGLLQKKPRAAFDPAGGKGKWEYGGSTGLPMIYANLMKNGEVIGWGTTAMGPLGGGGEVVKYGTAVYQPWKKGYWQLLPKCGIQDCRNAFCSGQVTTADNKLLIFGGHGNALDLTAARSYDHSTGRVQSTKMQSGRWYPTTCTQPDGRVLIVGGVQRNGQGGYLADPKDRANSDNPTYTVYDPKTGKFGGDRKEMQPQLNEAWPVHLFPQVILLPDGHIAVSAGRTLVNYERTGTWTFGKSFSYHDRPGAPWSYPQTGVGIPLPMAAPYKQLLLLATGGSSKDRASTTTPASNAAQIIDLTAGPNAPWINVGPMPTERVMGDGLYLCDGTIAFFGGARKGRAGWGVGGVTFTWLDGTKVKCKSKCGEAGDPVHEVNFFDPNTGRWSAKNALAPMNHPRMYHASAILLPDCRVMMAGSDVTKDITAEIFTPPHLSLGPRPVITWAPDAIIPGATLTLRFASQEPVVKALLLRTGAATHSMFFDARALWLTIVAQANGVIILQLPPNYNVLPPGMYMVTLITARGVPSEAKIVSNYAPK